MWRRHFERRAFQRISNVKFSFGSGWRKVGREGGQGRGSGGSMRANIVFFLPSFFFEYFYCLVEYSLRGVNFRVGGDEGCEKSAFLKEESKEFVIDIPR